MAFVPKQPTFLLDVTPWSFDIATRVRTMGTTFKAQMYPPIRTSDNEGSSDGYIVYPKANNVLKDPRQYNNAGTDALTFAWLGMTWGFVVEQVLPRWISFPNEHLMCLVRRMTLAELVGIAGPLPLPPAPDDEFALPQFLNSFRYYKLVSTGPNFYEVPVTLDGQVFCPWLDQTIPLYADMYLLSPKESGIRIPYIDGPAGQDLVAFNWPTGNPTSTVWSIAAILPRFLGFSGEHFAMQIEPSSMAEADIPQLNIPNDANSSIVRLNDMVPADGVSVMNFQVQLLDAFGNPCVGHNVTLSPVSPSAPPIGRDPTTATTDSGGNVILGLNDTTPEAVSTQVFDLTTGTQLTISAGGTFV